MANYGPFGGLFGLGSGANQGFNYNPLGPGGVQTNPILNPGNLDQSNNLYDQSQTGINQQQAFVNALQGQNGIANQSNVFNQAQGLANQYQNVANGTGPNPALQQLQNTTGQNIASQAALMAGQRGSGANQGLVARQIGQQGANINQQAAGQGATLAAQQQLAGMQGLQNQQSLLGNLAGQQVGQQANALTGYNQAAQSEVSYLLKLVYMSVFVCKLPAQPYRFTEC